MTLEELKAKAEVLAGRPLQVEKTKDGKWVVLWMAFRESPPPKGGTEQEALEFFIERISNRKVDSAMPEAEDDTAGGQDGTNA